MSFAKMSLDELKRAFRENRTDLDCLQELYRELERRKLSGMDWRGEHESLLNLTAALVLGP